ncbi:hypothetical protein [Bradyrhizobium sp. USDA 4350]
MDANEVKPDGYILFDTETGKPWGMQVFARRCDAGNSYNANKRWVMNLGRDVPGWTRQTRFIAKPIRIIDAETGDYFT